METEITIRPLTTMAEMELVEDLEREIWPGSEVDIVPAHLTIALAHNGGVVLGAFSGDRMVGFVRGFLGIDNESSARVAMARLKHHSHQLGVLPEYRARGLGYQLKVAQREAVLGDGIRLITWTYDPLLSVNGNLNIRRLGAVCQRYYREYYGGMRDGLNVGLASDRFSVDWWITSPRVAARLSGERKPLELAHFLAAGAQKVNPATLGGDDLMHPSESVSAIGSTFGLVEIPPDFLALKAHDLGLAQAWRWQTREIFESLFESGYIVTDFIYFKEEKHPRSYYVLSHGDSTLG